MTDGQSQNMGHSLPFYTATEKNHESGAAAIVRTDSKTSCIQRRCRQMNNKLAQKERVSSLRRCKREVNHGPESACPSRAIEVPEFPERSGLTLKVMPVTGLRQTTTRAGYLENVCGA